MKSFQNIFLIPIINLLWGIVAGERYNYKDPRMTDFFNMMVTAMRTPLGQPDVTWFFPFLGNIFPCLEQKVDHFSGKPGDVKHFLNQTIQHHKDTFDSSNIRDFIDAYLFEIKVKRDIVTYRVNNLHKANIAARKTRI